jgi:XTP/dITP diphosphohydrolase
VRLVLASANPHKAAEMAAVLAAAAPWVELVARPPEVPDVVEDGDTLVDNARLKARALLAATGEASVADDTGLEVDALGGAPGVRTARFAGPSATDAENVAELLRRLHGVAPEARAARFRAVALVALPDGRELRAEGVVEGAIAGQPRGGAGFGYDPVFVPGEGDGRTLAELAEEGPEVKHRISHRGRSLRALATQLAALRA